MRSAGVGKIVVAVLALLVPPVATAQDRSQTFSGSADVVAVEIPVQVLQDGEPVRGLKASDFEIYEGKKRQTVTGFEVLDLGTLGAETPAAEIPIGGRRHFLLLFDLTFSEPSAIVQARGAAKKLLTELHPADLAAVATFSTLLGPQLVIGFTPDREQLALAIDTLGVPQLVERGGDPLRLGVSLAEGRVISRGQLGKIAYTPTETLGGDGSNGRDVALLEAFNEYSAMAEHADRAQQTEMVQRLTGSYAQLARLMSSVVGRKYVVLLSQGYDATLLSGTVDDTLRKELQEEALSSERALRDDSNDRFGDTKSANRVERMLEEFRRADCIVQAVDISGLRTANDQGPHLVSGKDSLLQIAKDTGGELFENFNDLGAAMGKMLKNTSVTYVLTFQPENALPGEYRKLEVRLKNPPRGAKVSYRPGYYAPRAYAQQSPLEKVLTTGSQLLGEERGGVRAEVLALPLLREGEPAYVTVLVEVDGPTLMQGRNGSQMPVEVYVYALNGKGAVVDFITQIFGLEMVKAEPVLREGGFKFFGHLALEPGSYDLRVLVRNGVTGASGLRVVKLEVPAAGSEPFLLPTLFPEEGRSWLMAREAQKLEEQEIAYPFLRSGQPYVPASRAQLEPGAEAPVVLLGFGLKPGTWKVEAQVVAAEGGAVQSSGGIALGAATQGAESPLAQAEGTFRVPALPAGDYLLKVTLTDSGGAVASSRAAVRLTGGRSGSGTR